MLLWAGILLLSLSRPMDIVSAPEEQPTLAPLSSTLRSRRGSLFLGILFFLYSLGLLIYSQTMAFVWDEGFHLLAAQLINKGKIPYVDFCFPQTLLNAYWNAAWMRLFGQTWRVTHIAAALLIAGGVYLISPAGRTS